MRKTVLTAIVLFCFLPVVAFSAQISVKYQKGLHCHANDMMSRLKSLNKGFNGKIELEVFCKYGAVKYITISRSTGGGQSRYVPDSLIRQCGNPCK